jgi:transposase
MVYFNDLCPRKETLMPKLLFARQPLDAKEAGRVRQLAHSTHAPADWRWHAKMIVASWEHQRTTQIATALGCHPQTVRERIAAFDAQGLAGLGVQPGRGCKPRITHQEQSQIVALARRPAPGHLERLSDGTLQAEDETKAAQWTLNALTAAAHAPGIRIERSQVRRILRAEKVRWRHTRSWLTSHDPDFVAKGRRSSPVT